MPKTGRGGMTTRTNSILPETMKMMTNYSTDPAIAIFLCEKQAKKISSLFIFVIPCAGMPISYEW